jgi:hypothetical protein
VGKGRSERWVAAIKHNPAGVLIGKSFANDLSTLTEFARIILTSEGESLPPHRPFEMPPEGQLDIGFYEDATLIFINDIRHIATPRLSKMTQIFKFLLNEAIDEYVFDYYKDGSCQWDEYISLDEYGVAKSSGSNAVRFQGKDIATEVCPAIIRQLFGIELDDMLGTSFKRFSFQYNFNK